MSNVSSAAALPASEDARLRDLYDYRVLDTEQEESFDELVRFAAELYRVPVAQINLIDIDRQWTKADVGGLPLQCPRGDSFCAQAILEPERVLAVADAHADPRFASNPSVLDDPNIRFYAGAPLVTPHGHAIGALCLVDYVPRRLTQDEQDRLLVLARQVVTQLELRRRLTDERSRVEELRELDRLRNAFVNMVVHDLRNPLTAIHGFSELLRTGRMGELSHAQAMAVDAIGTGADQLRALVDELLGTAELLSGDVKIDPAPTDLAGLLRDGVARAEASAGGKITFQIEAPQLAVVTADARRLGQVLDNLLSNAVKYTPAGGTISARVLVGDQVTVEVADTGIGIPGEELPSLFSPFFRASTAMKSGITGTGLGLCVVKAIVEAHGGVVRVRSALDRGTTVTVELPAERPVARHE